jgi:hypothetical protein
MKSVLGVVFALGIAVAPVTGAMAQSDADLIAKAKSAAPEAVGANATVVAFEADGKMRTLQKGSNIFTCIPDDPQTPGEDPMCLDPNAMEWAEAWMQKKDPPAGKIGFGYMLKGGPTASNADPFATAPAPGKDWLETGPHVMIFNVGDKMAGYPRDKENPDSMQPYVMWPDTPYEHLMIPVR